MTGAIRVAIVAAICAMLVMTSTAHAADAVVLADLQAATRSLGFLDTLQNQSTIAIAVVYGDQAGDTAAGQAVNALAQMRGQNSSVFRATSVTVSELARSTQHFDALYLMPSATSNAKQVSDLVRRLRVVSISNEPSCLDGKYCVLMVRAGSGVNIVLDTGLAADLGVRFSSIFTMMVNRR